MSEFLKDEIKGRVHFIGIGGIGMSALAFLLQKNNFQVQGSDVKESYITEKLKSAQIPYFIGHDAKNVDNEISLVVKTSIIDDNNPELIKARQKNIKIITRAELLAKIMKGKKPVTLSGTHGKTSTTAMVATVFDECGLDPTVINGGFINKYQSNFKIGKSDYIVAESDESDGSFINLPSFIGAITNIEPEHLDFYNGDFEKVKKHYQEYIEKIPDKGACFVCIDNKDSRELYEKLKGKKNLFSYSVKQKADIFAKNIKFDCDGSKFDVQIQDETIKDVYLSTFGIHNVANSLVAISAANFLGVDSKKIQNSLKNYQGVKRRFTKVGQVNKITIIDDYAHHPTEIRATLNSANQCVQNNKIILVFQPHKNSRVNDLFEEFCQSVQEADIVIVADIYSVKNQLFEGVSQDSLIARMKSLGHKNVIKLEKEIDLAQIIHKNANPGDLVLCAGAGSITTMANNLVDQLQELQN